MNELTILWTTDNREVVLKMLFMYAFNSKKNAWWKSVNIIVWGPSSRLISEDEEIQDYIKEMMDQGIRFEACKACSDMYNVSEILADLGMDVKYMGIPLTEYLKSDKKILTL